MTSMAQELTQRHSRMGRVEGGREGTGCRAGYSPCPHSCITGTRCPLGGWWQITQGQVPVGIGAGKELQPQLQAAIGAGIKALVLNYPRYKATRAPCSAMP